MTLWLQLLVIGLCVVGAAFYSGIETGIISVRRLRVRHHAKAGDRNARILARFLAQPDRLLGTTLLGTNICVVITSIVSARLGENLVGQWGKVVSSTLVGLILLLFGEYVPKAWFRARPYVRSAAFVPLLEWSWKVLQPAARAVTWVAGLLVPGTETSAEALGELATRVELKLLASEGEQYGVLTPVERKMIHRAIELSEYRAGQIMVHREQIKAVASGTTVAELYTMARDSGFRRFPVYDGKGLLFVGVVDLFDVFAGEQSEQTGGLTGYVRPPVLIPEELPADEILSRLRLARQPMGLVVNGVGEMTGLVTTEDVIRQIVAS